MPVSGDDLCTGLYLQDREPYLFSSLAQRHIYPPTPSRMWPLWVRGEVDNSKNIEHIFPKEQVNFIENNHRINRKLSENKSKLCF
jgi:hypothetical protein